MRRAAALVVLAVAAVRADGGECLSCEALVAQFGCAALAQLGACPTLCSGRGGRPWVRGTEAEENDAEPAVSELVLRRVGRMLQSFGGMKSPSGSLKNASLAQLGSGGTNMAVNGTVGGLGLTAGRCVRFCVECGSCEPPLQCAHLYVCSEKMHVCCAAARGTRSLAL